MSQAVTVPPPASAVQALGMLQSAMGYLAAADATAMAAETQARCLRVLEQVSSVGTAARTSILAAFTSGQGYSGDADYSPRAWLIHQTRITKGAAVGYTAWVRRAAAHPRDRAGAGRRGRSRSRSPGPSAAGPTSCPADCQQDADAILLGAAAGGADVADLAGLAGEIYARSLPQDKDKDEDEAFGDRSVKLETTFQGAGVLTGDLTPECASILATVLDALSAPAGAEDTRSQPQRCHDALHEAMRRLVTAGLLPERAGQPVKAVVHISLADLMVLDGSSALLQEWTSPGPGAVGRAPRPRLAGRGWRRGLAGRRRRRSRRLRCGDGPVRHRRREPRRAGGPGPAVRPARPAPPPPPRRGSRTALRRSGDSPGTRRRRHRRRPRQHRLRPGRDHPGYRPGLGGPGARDHRQGGGPAVGSGRAGVASCGAGSSAPGWAGRACRWTSGSPSRSRPGSATPSPSETSTASGPDGATSPPPPAKSTTSGTRRTAAPPAPKTACCCASSTIRSSSTSGAGPSS